MLWLLGRFLYLLTCLILLYICMLTMVFLCATSCRRKLLCTLLQRRIQSSLSSTLMMMLTHYSRLTSSSNLSYYNLCGASIKFLYDNRNIGANDCTQKMWPKRYIANHHYGSHLEVGVLISKTSSSQSIKLVFSQPQIQLGRRFSIIAAASCRINARYPSWKFCRFCIAASSSKCCLNV